jgi:probable rRNA maturation factor
MSSRGSIRRPARNSSQTRRKRGASASGKLRVQSAVSCRFEIEVANQQRCLRVAASRIRRIVRHTLEAESIRRATISIVLVDNRTIHQLNRQHLNHDYETDVLSFLFATEADHAVDEGPIPGPREGDRYIDGEIVISAEMATQSAVSFGWSAAQELELYLVHGLLHLCGYDDSTDTERRLMRRRERSILKLVGD